MFCELPPIAKILKYQSLYISNYNQFMSAPSLRDKSFSFKLQVIVVMI